jgi:GNAT superfamily N-acetyltransferase
VVIRPARPAELPQLIEIEVSAGSWFADIGMPEIAADDPGSIDELRGYQQAGRAFVATDAQNTPVAYLLIEILVDAVHLEQLSVRADHARRGIGRSLIEYADGLARDRGYSCLTLCTFADVPWNAPYYERCGFRRLSDSELSVDLLRVRAAESSRGLDRWPRVVMRRDIRSRLSPPD